MVDLSVINIETRVDGVEQASSTDIAHHTKIFNQNFKTMLDANLLTKAIVLPVLLDRRANKNFKSTCSWFLCLF